MDCFFCIDLKSFYASVECVERGFDPLLTNLVVADEENDILAFKEADVSVLTIEQQEEVSPKMMDKTDYVIEDIIEVTMIDF